jgi:retinol dehydrogenase 12
MLRYCSGIMAVPVDQVTKDGYDAHFGVNVLGHVHLTTLLMPAILASPAPRIINLTSMGHNMASGINFETLKGTKTPTSIPGAQLIQQYQYYGQSKLVSPTMPTLKLE